MPVLVNLRAGWDPHNGVGLGSLVGVGPPCTTLTTPLAQPRPIQGPGAGGGRVCVGWGGLRID